MNSLDQNLNRNEANKQLIIEKNYKGERVLVGHATSETILANFQDFKENYDSYLVNSKLLNRTISFDEDIEILTILGTWCKDSSREVSRFMKIIQAIDNYQGKVSYYGLHRSKKDNEGLAQLYNIRLLPTFVILKNSKELGRIVEKPSKSIEEDLFEILNARDSK